MVCKWFVTRHAACICLRTALQGNLSNISCAVDSLHLLSFCLSTVYPRIAEKTSPGRHSELDLSEESFVPVDAFKYISGIFLSNLVQLHLNKLSTFPESIATAGHLATVVCLVPGARGGQTGTCASSWVKSPSNAADMNAP